MRNGKICFSKPVAFFLNGQWPGLIMAGHPQRLLVDLARTSRQSDSRAAQMGRIRLSCFLKLRLFAVKRTVPILSDRLRKTDANSRRHWIAPHIRREMSLTEYFEENQGVGVLSTADAEGRVNAAIYSRPHIMDEGTLASIMPDSLAHHNLNSTLHAAYLFRENEPGYKGKRVYPTKVREEKDAELIRSLRRKVHPPEVEQKGGSRSIVFFTIGKVLPLVGTGE